MTKLKCKKCGYEEDLKDGDIWYEKWKCQVGDGSVFCPGVIRVGKAIVTCGSTDIEVLRSV